MDARGHGLAQRQALSALYEGIGFARSLLAYELPTGQLKLIDGHLRRDLDPDMEVDVEILDVSEEEARALLLSIDPLAELAEHKEQIHQRLMELTPAPSEDLAALWQQADQTIAAALKEEPAKHEPPLAWQSEFFVLVKCGGEREQVELLERFLKEGLDCRALAS